MYAKDSQEKNGFNSQDNGIRRHITSILRCKLPHSRREALVKLVLPGDEGLAYRLLPEAEHTRVSPHLVHKGLKEHPFPQIPLRLCLHPLDGWAHPPGALDSPSWSSWTPQTCRRMKRTKWPQYFFFLSFVYLVSLYRLFTVSDVFSAVQQDINKRNRKEEERRHDRRKNTALCLDSILSFTTRII